MRKLKEFYYYYSKKGAIDTFKRIKQRYFGISTFILFERDLTSPTPLSVNIDKTITCIEGDLNLLQKEREGRVDLPREFYIDQTHGGNKFYFVYKNKKLAYIHWYFIKGEYSRFFNIQSHTTVELNYNYTLPEFRGNRLSSIAINYIAEDLKQKGFNKIVSAVSQGNILAIKGLCRNSFNEMKTVKSVCSFVQKTQIRGRCEL